MNPDFPHISVLHDEIISYLPEKAKIAIDFTLGGAGHTKSLLEANSGLFIYGVDRDLSAIEAAEKFLSPFSGRFSLVQKSFSLAARQLSDEGIKADYIIADLGVSSVQLDERERGFSFRHDGPLDMRMNKNDFLTAEKIVNEWGRDDLIKIIRRYGEENFAPRVADRIIKRREEEPFTTTKDLADCIYNAIPRKFHSKKIHPATKTFQAIRIAVNNELGEIEELLDSLPGLVKPDGLIAIISFHSLEDRLIKRKFNEWESPCNCPTDIPHCICGAVPLGKRVSRKPVLARKEETEQNPRARSAKLRIFKRK